MGKKRFSRLNYSLKSLRKPNSTELPPDAPAGSVLRNYQDVVSGKKVLTYPRSADSKPGALLQVSVLPFFFGGEAGSETIVSLSQRADLASSVESVQAACNQITVDPETHKELRGFTPAQATVFIATGSDSVETSKITGVRYNKKGGASYTLPYGASASEKAEGNVRKDILAAVNADPDNSVSFTSEKV